MKHFLLLLLFTPFAVNAQDDDSTRQKKMVKVISIAAMGGSELFREGFEDRTIFQESFPSSPLAFANLDGFLNDQLFYRYDFTTNVTSGIFLNLRFREQKKFSEFRIGLSHSTTTIAAQYYSKQTITRTDTITLSNGDFLYTDSSEYSEYAYEWDNEVISLHLSWLVRTDPRNLLNLYTGIGLSGGIGFNGTYRASYTSTSVDRYYNSNGHFLYAGNQEVHASIHEQFKAPFAGAFSAYIPIGANLRLARKPGRFLSHVALVAEYQGGIQFIFPGNSDTKVRTYSGLSGGVRWYIVAPKVYPPNRKRKRNRDENRNVD